MQPARLQEAIDAERQKEQYIDRTSHEIRNPLSAMLQSTETIMSTLKGQSMHSSGSSGKNLSFSHDAVESMLDATKSLLLCVNHQRRIVDDVLTLSKLDSRLLHLTSEPVDPEVLAQQTLKMFRGGFKEANINAEVALDASWKKLGIEMVYLDPHRVQQALMNFITNAVNFSKDSPERRIEVHLSGSLNRPFDNAAGIPYQAQTLNDLRRRTPSNVDGQDVYVMFQVRDTGSGLTRERMDKLFQRFEQGPVRTYAKYGGSGLGLAISKELVELHGGQVGVSSEVGRGSTFAFYVRVTRATRDIEGTIVPSSKPKIGPSSSDKSIRISTDRYDQASARTPPQQPPTPSSAEDNEEFHILLVEDNVLNQKILAKQLRNSGCKVAVADNGQEALHYIKRTVFKPSPDSSDAASDRVPLSVILMDIHMPVLDGLAATGEIREMEKNGRLRGHCPIIAVNANARKEQKDEAMARGMDSIITKPFSISDVMAEIRRTLAASP